MIITPQPLFNTIVAVLAKFYVSYPICVLVRAKCIGYIGRGVCNSSLGSKPVLCTIQNGVITNCVIKRSWCTFFFPGIPFQYIFTVHVFLPFFLTVHEGESGQGGRKKCYFWPENTQEDQEVQGR